MSARESRAGGVHAPSAAAGALAGLAATLPMTGVMGVGAVLGLLRTPPPEQIVAAAEAKARPALAVAPSRAPGWLAVHFGIGAACGAGYPLLRRWLPGSTPAAGVAYGLGVWATGYLALLPALGLFPPAWRDARGRQAVMLGAHVVYGAALAELMARAAPDAAD